MPALQSLVSANVQRDGLTAAFTRRDICLLTSIETSLIHGTDGYLGPDFAEAVSDYLSVGPQDTSEHESTSTNGIAGGNAAMKRTEQSIIERIRIQAYQVYIAEASERYEHEGGKTRGFALRMGEWIEKGVKKVDRRFEERVTR